ncbi:hypothetical protein GEMRC1_002732 [Eukaryota sp. GEM-RC1]
MNVEPLLKKSRSSDLDNDNDSSYSDTCSTPDELYPIPILLQHSLLVLISSHSLRSFIRSRTDSTILCTSSHRYFKQPLYDFFERFGFVSEHFFKVSFIGAKLFFETNTFSRHCFFLFAKLRSIHLYEKTIIDVSAILPFNRAISKLKTTTSTVKVLDLLTQTSSFYLPQLIELDVEIPSNDSFTPFARALMSNSTIQELHISFSQLTLDLLDNIEHVFLNMTTLTKVVLSSHHSVPNHDLSRVCTALSKTIGLKIVHLNFIFLFLDRNDDCTFILPLLSCSTLKTLKLAWFSNIDSQVFPALLNNKSLEVLELQSTNLKENTPSDIGEVLKFNSILKKLVVSRRNVCFSPIFKSLLTNKSLLDLEIYDRSNYPFSDLEAQLLAQMFKENTGLLVFNLDSHSLDSSLINQMFQSLQVNSTLRKLVLPHLDLTALLACFDSLCSFEITTHIDISPHYFNISCGLVNYAGFVFNEDVVLLLNTLKSNVPIKRFTCQKWEFTSVKIMIEAFELCTVYRSVIDVDFSPNHVNVDDGMFCFNPAHLKDVSADEISSLQTFLDYHGIFELSLKKCRFSEESVASLRELIKVNTSLTSIDLSLCQLSDDNILNIFGDLSVSSSLTDIKIGQNHVTFQGLLRIFKLFYENTMISSVDVSPHSFNISSGDIRYDKRITKEDLILLLDFLKSGIPIVDVTHDGYNSKCLHSVLIQLELRSFSPYLIDLHFTPKILKIDNNMFSYCPKYRYLGPSSNDLIHLQSFLKRFGFKMLVLKGCDFCDDGSSGIRDLLTTCTNLTSVELSQCKLSCRNILKMFGDFKLNSSSILTRINLSRNSISNQGVLVLAQALTVNPITEICLQFNSINDEGASALAEALKSGSIISKLYLQSNSIGNEGAIALADALKVNNAVSVLFLQSNLIGNEGALALTEALEVNFTIKEINLRNNPIDFRTQDSTNRKSRDRLRYSFW